MDLQHYIDDYKGSAGYLDKFKAISVLVAMGQNCFEFLIRQDYYM